MSKSISTTSETRTSVVLDGHPLWAEAVEGVLKRVGVDVVAKTTSAHEALTLIQLAPRICS